MLEVLQKNAVVQQYMEAWDRIFAASPVQALLADAEAALESATSKTAIESVTL